MHFFEYLQQHQIFLLFVIITLGFILGRIRAFGISLESSGILFVAMLFGHFGFTLNNDFQTFGLVLFIYSIGLQAGPSLLNVSKASSLKYYYLVLVLLISGAALTAGLSYLMHVDMNLAIGVFAGAMTSTPGLAVVQETTHSALSSTGYGVVYPIGVIGVIVFIRLLPKIFRVKIKDEEKGLKLSERNARQKVVSRCVLITNKEIDGKTLKELDFEDAAGVIMSRIMHNGEVHVPSDDTVLHINDVVRLVGSHKKINTAIPFLGHETDLQVTETERFESRKFVLTNSKIVGKKISDLNLRVYYNANITRIRRGGVEFAAEPNQMLAWGDRLRVAGAGAQMDKIAKLFGDEVKKLEQGDIFSIILGILLGILAGLIPFSIGKIISFNLGLTGGILLAGLFLSNRGKIGPIIWQVPVSIINFMRELGVTFFLAVVGIKAGSQAMQIFSDGGLKLLLFGALVALIPMVIMSLVARFKYKIMIIELAGLISGGMTSTPGLASAMEITGSQKPLVVYATIYPAAMLLMMIFVKILALLR